MFIRILWLTSSLWRQHRSTVWLIAWVGLPSGHSTERCRKTGTSRQQTRLLLVAGQRWPGQGFRDFSWLLLSLIVFELWARRGLREADRVRYGVVWAAIARSSSCISKTGLFSGYLFIPYARGPRVCVVCDCSNTTAQLKLEDKKKSRQNGFSKLESEKKSSPTWAR